jgi:hypothetical protein
VFPFLALAILLSTGFLLGWAFRRSKTQELTEAARYSRYLFVQELSREPLVELYARACEQLAARGWGDPALLPDDEPGLLRALEGITATLPDDRAHRDALFEVGGLADVIQALRLRSAAPKPARAGSDVWSPPPE